MLEAASQGIKIFRHNLSVKFCGRKKYSGNDDAICRQIIDDCYDTVKGYFRASSGNYKVFYSRDFGWCVGALLRLGYDEQVLSTLKYALGIYEKHCMITVAIDAKGRPFNFPDAYSPDSIAYLYRSLRIAKSKEMIMRHKTFLNAQLGIFEKNVLSKDGSLQKRHFSGMRDHARGYHHCYDMLMACMLCDEVDKINMMMGKEVIKNVLSTYDLKKKLMTYWNGSFFIDSPDDPYCSGHANTYPYFLNVVSDKKMLKRSVESIQDAGLDMPLALKYGFSEKTKFIWQDIFAHDWEKDTVWTMLGFAYIDVLSRIDRKDAKMHLLRYKNIIERHGLIELFDGKSIRPYSSFFFSADDSMLWASMYLDLKRRLKIKA